MKRMFRKPDAGRGRHWGPGQGRRTSARRAAGFTLLEALVAVTVMLIVAAISITYIWRARLRANEASAVASLRLITSAEQTYFTTYSMGFSDTLAELGPPPGGSPSSDAADLVPVDLISGQKSGYLFVYKPISVVPVPGKGKGKGLKKIKAVVYQLTAEPIQVDGTGVNYYYVNETGVIRAGFRARATASSPPL